MDQYTNGSSVLSFIDQVNKQQAIDKFENDWAQTPTAKYRKLQEVKAAGMNTCMNHILGKLCKSSLPEINGRTPNVQDLDKIVADYISRRTGGRDSMYYVKEALKRNPNNQALRSLLESVKGIIKEQYHEKDLEPDKITDADLSFSITPAIDEKLEKVIKENELDGLSDVIKSNVKNNAIDEVEKAKQEKDERKSLEDELSKDESITSEAALDRELALRGINMTNVYNPSLFGAVMIHAFNNITESTADFADCVDMGLYTESFLGKVKVKRQEKKAADAKATVAANAPGFVATLEEIYKQTYSLYRSEVSPIDTDKLAKQFSAAVSTQKKELKVKLPDIKTYAAEIKGYKDLIKTSIKSGRVNKSNPPKYKLTTYSAEDALSIFRSAVNALDSEFAHPNMKGFVDNLSKTANALANRQATPMDVNSIYNAMGNVALADAYKLIANIDLVNAFVKYAGSLIKHSTNGVAKEAAFDNAITEYTMLNISKALRLEDFRGNLNKLISEYARS